MGSRVTHDLLLVGSIPLESSEEVLRTCGQLFGDAVFALPDGETGERIMWVNYEAHRLHHPHPDIETLQRPVPPPGYPEWVPSHLFATYSFQLKPNVTHFAYGRLPRIDDALRSYELLRSLREQGDVPEDVRLQVCLPFPASAIGWFFRENFAHDYPRLEAAYEDAMARGIEELVQAIPADDLAIQWDVCFEVLDLERLFQWTDREGAWERFAGPVKRLSRLVPEDVLLGYHICYGTLPEWPMREANDMRLCVDMANTAVETSGRTVDWLHLAGPRHLRSEDEDFFRPLRDLRPGDAKVYLGLILPVDGADGLQRRAATARKFLPKFGIAGYCGFGRQPGEDPTVSLRKHRETADTLAPAR